MGKRIRVSLKEKNGQIRLIIFDVDGDDDDVDDARQKIAPFGSNF